MSNGNDLKIEDIKTETEKFPLRELCLMIEAAQIIEIVDRNGVFLYTNDCDGLLFPEQRDELYGFEGKGRPGFPFVQSAVKPLVDKDVLKIKPLVGKNCLKTDTNDDCYVVKTTPVIEVTIDTTLEEYRSEKKAIEDKAKNERYSGEENK